MHSSDDVLIRYVAPKPTLPVHLGRLRSYGAVATSALLGLVTHKDIWQLRFSLTKWQP